jgi:hypothetical protein
VWALVETALAFPSSGGRRSSVHGCGSVHAVVGLTEDVRELHHLTGHYLFLWGFGSIRSSCATRGAESASTKDEPRPDEGQRGGLGDRWGLNLLKCGSSVILDAR